MGWIYAGGNKFINVSHIVSITFDVTRGIYVIRLDNDLTIETSVFRANMGLKDIEVLAIPEPEEIPF